MGICLSVESGKANEIKDGHEVVALHTDLVSLDGTQKLVASACSKQGSKGLNQDAAIVYQRYGTEDGAFCGVFDGHGPNGHVVSKMVRNRLPSLLLNWRNGSDDSIASRNEGGSVQWKEAFVGAFKEMDREIKLRKDLDCSCSGTTAVVAVKQGQDLFIANLGDSRAMLGTFTEKGLQLVPLTTDMKPDLPEEAKRIQKCNGLVAAVKEDPHTYRLWAPVGDSPGLAMSRAFGNFRLKNHGLIAIPDVSFHHIEMNDQFLVLATDGVWDVLTNQEITALVWGATGEEVAASAVVRAAKMAWNWDCPTSKSDDCTAVCIFLAEKGFTDKNHLPTVQLWPKLWEIKYNHFLHQYYRS